MTDLEKKKSKQIKECRAFFALSEKKENEDEDEGAFYKKKKNDKKKQLNVRKMTNSRGWRSQKKKDR